MNKFGTISLRINEANLDHHLWNNNGTWYIHYTVHPTPNTQQRVRTSLKTKSLKNARLKRDRLFASIKNSKNQIPVPSAQVYL